MLLKNFSMRNNKPFIKTASLYDAIYAKKQYGQEARVINKLIRLYNVKGKRLIDLGCGTGKHCVEFARLGYMPTGIDCSLPMLTIAKQNIDASGRFVNLIHTKIDSYKPRKKFDVATSLFHVLSYQTTNDSVEKYFRAASRCIKPGGLFIFDCWYGPGVFFLAPKNSKRALRFNNSRFTRNKKSMWDTEQNLVHVHHTIHAHGKKIPPTHELHSMRYFFLPELTLFLSMTGFRLLEWGTLGAPLKPIGKIPSWDIWLIAQKNL